MRRLFLLPLAVLLLPPPDAAALQLTWQPARAPETEQTGRSPRELELLERIRTRPPVVDWRRYAGYRFLWNGWRLHPNGVRTTRVERRGPLTLFQWQSGDDVAVDCRLLLWQWNSGFEIPDPLPERRPDRSWNEPSGPMAEMVADVCANTVMKAGEN